MIDLARKYRIAPSLIKQRRADMEGDAWLFYKWIWAPYEREDKAVERFHRPLFYALDGDAERLAWCLDRFKSKVVDDIKHDLRENGVDWHNDLLGVKKRLRKINNRMSRGFSKTTYTLCVLLKAGSVDPNESIAIGSRSDKAAFGFCETIGNIMRAPNYQIYFSDRLFRLASGKFNLLGMITKEFIRMNGRTVPKQETIEARGLRKQWPGHHFTLIDGDDLSGSETGDATMPQALTWLGNLAAISMPPGFKQHTRIIINGTKQGGVDDFEVTSNDRSYLTLRVPAWTKKVPCSIANVMKDGEVTLPEYMPLGDLIETRESARQNPKHGLIWFMRNYELSDELGALHFSGDLVRRQKFLWVEKLVRNAKGEVEKRRFMRRYLWMDDFAPKIGEKANPGGICECWLNCGDPKHAYVDFDPLALPRVLGVDQAVSVEGDPWGVSGMARDPFGHLYWLRGEYGRGYGGMVDAIVRVFNKWGGLKNPPRYVGIETGAWQTTTTYWMQRGDIFGDLARRVIKMPAGQMHKVERLFNNILIPMLAGTLHLDPDDIDRDHEMYDYAGKNPTDGLLDSGSIASCAHTIPAHDTKAEYTDLVEARREYADQHDRETGIDLSPDFIEDALRVNPFGDDFDLN